jgi:hypothetical protein
MLFFGIFPRGLVDAVNLAMNALLGLIR